jgi:hypothetical protein
MSEVQTPEQLEEQANSLLGLEDMEDIDMDSVESAPGFINPENGRYTFGLTKAAIETYEIKRGERKGQKAKRIKHIYMIASTLQLNDPKEKPPADGSLCSSQWNLDEKGLSYWKPHVEAMIGSTKGMKLGVVIQALNEKQPVFEGKVKTRVTKGDDGKEYTNFSIQVLSNGEEVEKAAADSGL